MNFMSDKPKGEDWIAQSAADLQNCSIFLILLTNYLVIMFRCCTKYVSEEQE